MPKQRRGFAAMSEDKRRELSSRGGLRVQELGRGHQWTADEARRQGRRGGLKSGRKRREAA
jgi:uncharacterized protein